jgi:NAD(P)-dependent dehydrogenase (short-subunit alcohol dehydrogenase family)
MQRFDDIEQLPRDLARRRVGDGIQVAVGKLHTYHTSTVAIWMACCRRTQAALPFMKHDGSAAIVNIGSIAGEMGTNGMYSAMKFGIRGLSDSLRRELWTKRIAVSLIEPGYIRTALTARVKGARPGPELVAQAVARVLERPQRALVVPSSWRLMLLGVRFFPAIADRLLGSAQGQARIHS